MPDSDIPAGYKLDEPAPSDIPAGYKLDDATPAPAPVAKLARKPGSIGDYGVPTAATAKLDPFTRTVGTAGLKALTAAGITSEPQLQKAADAVSTAGNVAIGGATGAEAAGLGEDVLGPILGRAVGRSAGIGTLGGAQGLAENPSDPKQAIRQAGWNTGLGVTGELATTGLTKTAEAVGPYAKKAANLIGDITPGKIKALGHIKQFLQSVGKTPEEIDAFTHGVEAQQRFADAHQKVLDVTHQHFSKRYDEVLGKPAVKAAQVDTSPIASKLNDTMQGLETDNRLGQMSPGVQKFIKDKQTDLGEAASVTKPAPSTNALGLRTGDPLHDKLAARIAAEGGPATAAPTVQGGRSVDELRSDLSQIRAKLRGRTTATDRAVLNEFHNNVIDAIDKALTDAAGPAPEVSGGIGSETTTTIDGNTTVSRTGASQGPSFAVPAQADIDKLRQTDQDYRRFQQTIGQIGDPRQALTGEQAARAIFDAVDTDNYGAVDQYAKLASAASAVHPQVATDLKDALLTKMFADATQTAAKAQTGVYGQIGSIRKSQSIFAHMAPDTIKSLFGPGTPMNDVRKMDQIFGRIASPEAKQQALEGATTKGGLAAMLSPKYLARFMLLYSTFSALSGSPTSPWEFPRKNPAAGIAIGLGMLWGPEAAKWVYSKTGAPVQQAYSDWIMEPGNPEKLRKFVDLASAGMGPIGADAQQPNTSSEK